jgi:formylglycine-generating enzyme required for sulfatase activity
MNGKEAKHLQALIRAKKDRLHQLELKEAKFGLNVPSHIPIEIEELRGEIKDLQTQLAALEKEQKAAPRLEEARKQVPTLAKPRRPGNWERVGAIAGVIGLLIALGTWLIPNFPPAWLSKTPTAIPIRTPTTVAAVTKPPMDTPTVTPTSSPTHTPVISTATLVSPTDTPTPILLTPTPVPPTDKPTLSAPPPGMVLVPASEFIMGSSDSDPDASGDEKPQHMVYLDAFYIDKYEVTNAQYRECVEAGACSQPHDTYWYNNPNRAEHPVVHVDWNQANNYCQWAEKRLPTEAEWEYTARGPQGRVFPWGDEFDGTRLNYCDANCGSDWPDETVDDGYADTAPVGSYPAGASWCGVLDMAGNVWEWVADWYDSGYYSQSPARNPPGPDSGMFKVLRGGSWSNIQWLASCAFRSRLIPWYRNLNVGFRCARSSP